ncbi:MAG TPA: ATP-binding protein [Polyangiaceae bacterium]|nr:ATP-binding protein [Polyangiaceae bacterium]
MGGDELDFKLLFQESPDVLLVLLPDAPTYTMVGATRARLEVTHTTREQTMGHGLFELFPDNPDDPGATGTSNLRASLDRVLATRAADTMAVQKYDIRGPDGAFQARYWSPRNVPVLGASGELKYILHRVEDVTELVRASEMGEELRDRTRAMEREVIARSRELSVANGYLRDANARLGELDTAKTTFFNNVSHEFRTPLTLMLGPLEDALADTSEPLGPEQKIRFELAHANALRLLKLVNALLDFSRAEAGRLRAVYAPVDMASLTAQLAGMFQSAVDKAGIRLVVECPPLSEPVWIDRDMWEKIVPNLVSNAFKFTHRGEIAVRVREEDKCAILEVSDTGVGIPEKELPKIFDRFHRVPGVEGRTHEGTGIGLSLVRELCELHGGRVSVESTVGAGTTFHVEIPKGAAHLPADALAQGTADTKPGRDSAAYAAEAARWTSSSTSESLLPSLPNARLRAPVPVEDEPTDVRARVLVVDDNADLRKYLSRLLSPNYDVMTAEDGEAALDVMDEVTPDIVVSDVMMPRLDGFGLVRSLRAKKKTSSIPVILLSARAGEESAIDGLDAGSDDYLIKPFSARELLARVRTHVDLARSRRAWIAELERTNHELDSFSYSVSHDLRAPLRAIHGFSGALGAEYSDQLDDKGRDYVQRIQTAVVRMTAMIDSMLELAQITRLGVKTAPVDLSAVAREIVSDLRSADPGRTVKVDIDDGLVARGDVRLVRVALVNLLGNAWKYSSHVEAPHIEFKRWPGDEPVFFVRDNGAGFDASHATKLFAPFQRFHNQSEFAGTGIGLATVQRIVLRHGGRIWADSAIGAGATFFFSLPDVGARVE